MRKTFRMIGLAAGLALTGLAGVSQAAIPAPNQQPATATAPQSADAATGGGQQAAAPAGANNIQPTTEAATPPAAPSSPLLAQNGAPPLANNPAIGQPIPGGIGIQPQVTKNGDFALWFHDSILFPVITAISLLVLGLLIWVILRYRQAANPIPSKTSHNTTIEVIWTLVPVIALVMIAVPSIGLLQAQFKPAPSGAVTLKAIGNQWYWTYQYPDHGGFEVTANMLKERDEIAPGERARTDADGPRLLATDNRIVLPVGVPIRLITTSNDVIHSWAMPAFWMKLDAIPGRLNETSFTIERPGLYFGQCSELCGPRHPFMPIAVQAVPPAQFAAWVAAKGGTMPATGAPSNKVIPQPESDAVDTTANSQESATTGAATVNAVEAGAPKLDRASGNNPGLGNPGQ
jgi:cytochrome c oxidase subunit 2